MCIKKDNVSICVIVLLRPTWAGTLVLSMEQQAGATQLCLNEQSATLLPGRHKIQDVWVRTQALVVSGFLHAPVPLTVAPKAMSRALHCILATILIALHLETHRKHFAFLLYFKISK